MNLAGQAPPKMESARHIQWAVASGSPSGRAFLLRSITRRSTALNCATWSFCFSDGDGLFLEEKRDMGYQVERMSPSQGYRISRRDSEGRFSFVKEVIADPMRPCVLLRTKIEGNSDFLQKLKAYVLCAPHLEVGGEANNAHVIEASGRQLLVAEKQNRWIVVGASCDFSRLSCGYVGHSDGYTDLV
ncbi:MAG: hypothetical protein WBW31_11645, partial [Candidatus Sulfotelmatobacter sp.]